MTPGRIKEVRAEIASYDGTQNSKDRMLVLARTALPEAILGVETERALLADERLCARLVREALSIVWRRMREEEHPLIFAVPDSLSETADDCVREFDAQRDTQG